jgi:hypothetical protein
LPAALGCCRFKAWADEYFYIKYASSPCRLLARYTHLDTHGERDGAGCVCYI